MGETVADEATARSIAARLGFAPGTPPHRYVGELARVRLDSCPSPLEGLEGLERRTVEELCRTVGLSPEDTADVVATWPSPGATPEWWWCVERAAARLVANMGDFDAPRGQWPGFEGPAHTLEQRCHFFHVAVAVLPHTIAFFEKLGVPEATAWAAVSDVARHAAIHRRMYGATGMDADWWVTLSLRAETVNLGRLQYNRHRLGHGDDGGSDPGPWYDAGEEAMRGEGFRRGDECIGLHIPDGPAMHPHLVEESLEMAGQFFGEYFPSERHRIVTCRSWLLDPQLGEYLPPDANIVAFQRRFELVPGVEPGDEDVLQFVFRAPNPGAADLGSLPRRTTLERAAVDHLRAGRHWFRRTGWIELAP